MFVRSPESRPRRQDVSSQEFAKRWDETFGYVSKQNNQKAA